MSSANRLPLHILPLNKQHTGLGAKGTPHGWPFTLWLTSENWNTLLLYSRLVVGRGRGSAMQRSELGLNYSFPEARPSVACGETAWFGDNCCNFLPSIPFFMGE